MSRENTEVTLDFLNETAELKEQLHQHGKALARIEHWHNRLGQGTEPSEAREAEWGTLETVLRIFKEEANR